MATPKKTTKPLKDKSSFVEDFMDAVKRMDKEAKLVDWQAIAKKQEDHLKIYLEENEQLAKVCVDRWNEITHLKYLITYLERKIEDFAVRGR